jgi:hypothetical protein
MDENLVGYLLDALDPDTREQVAARLASSPQARARLELLKRALEPLAADAEPPAPRPGLALSAVARVAEHRCRPLPDAPLPLPSQRVTPSSWRMPRRADLLVAAALLIVLAGLALPVLHRLRQTSARTACANNLKELWVSLQAYGDAHDRYLPLVEERGARSVAGIFVPILQEARVLGPDARLVCPADEGQAAPAPRRLAELEALYHRDRAAFDAAARDLAGSYAYTMGYVEGGTFHGLRTDSGGELPVLADRLPSNSAGGNSPNHGGAGQNVLYLSGAVHWCVQRNVGVNLDDIYVNRHNEVRRGVALEDTVLGCSEASP